MHIKEKEAAENHDCISTDVLFFFKKRKKNCLHILNKIDIISQCVMSRNRVLLQSILGPEYQTLVL